MSLFVESYMKKYRILNLPKNRIILVILIMIIYIPLFSQTPSVRQLVSFPEEYLGKTITFKNIYWWPVLESHKDNTSKIIYYQIKLNVSEETEEQHYVMGAMNKIMGVVLKKIAKQLVNNNMSGYYNSYYGTVTGKVIRTDIYGSEYLFVISKIVYQYQSGIIINTFE